MNFMKLAIVFVGAASAFFWEKKELPSVTLSSNDVITGLTQKRVDSFRGIPFAQPPIGELRFKRPVPFNGSLDGLEANDFGTTCTSFSPFHAMDYVGDIGSRIPGFPATPLDATKVGVMGEDCLTLNVWRPAGTEEGANLPVVVWIYGGVFQFGGPPIYPGDPIVSTSIKMGQPVIFVSMNYRIGPWGFLGGNAIQSEGSSNAGLADQRLAMEWVSDNIHSFGGDASKVTLMGESAGAMSIGYHSLMNGGDITYNGKDLFRGAIFQSGTALPVTAVNDTAPQHFFRALGITVGCDGNQTDAEMLDCIRYQPESSIRDYVDLISSDAYSLFDTLELFASLSPKVDGDLISEYPFTSFRNGSIANIPYITGNQEDEGSLFSLTLLRFLDTRVGVDTVFQQLFVNGFSAEVKKFLSLYPDDPAEGCPFRTEDRFAFQNQTKRGAAIFNDYLFTAPRRLQLQNAPKDVSKWVYLSDALHNISPLGTFHASDVFWQFYGLGTPTKAYNEYFISFINHLDPNKGTDLPFWPEYDTESLKTMRIGLTTVEESIDIFPQEGREEAIQLAMDTDLLKF